MIKLAMTYEEAKAYADSLNEACRKAGESLENFPKGPMGLTPDNVKASKEFRDAKAAFDTAFASLRAFNSMFTKQFAKKRLEERREFLRNHTISTVPRDEPQARGANS